MRRGIQVILSTHSEYVLVALSAEVPHQSEAEMLLASFPF